MSKWKKFREFVDKVDKLCAKPLGFEKKFVAEPWDTGGGRIKKGWIYFPASFFGKVENVKEFESCILSIASEYEEDVMVRPTTTFMPKGEVRVFVYFPVERDYISSHAIEATDLEEAEELLEEKGLL